MRSSKSKKDAGQAKTPKTAAEWARIFEEVYALRGMAAGYPLEEDLEEDRRLERLNEDRRERLC